MFVFLSKKIAIPNKVPLCSIAWSRDHDWIACGGEKGFLKVVQLEIEGSNESSQANSTKKKTGNPLRMNQTLENHRGNVVLARWNEECERLTTSDDTGHIIVWMLHKNTWYEEMVNSRNKSYVVDMKWTPDGQAICIAYEDGHVIAGGVDGNRLWSRDSNQPLSAVAWSADGRLLLFGTSTGQVVLFDGPVGNLIGHMTIFAHDEDATTHDAVVGIAWYDGSEGYSDPDSPVLAIGFANGRCQLMRHEFDQSPVILITDMNIRYIEWNPSGTILAIGGVQRVKASTGEEKDVNIVQYFTPMGIHLRSLRIPGNSFTGMSWEGNGLRMCLAVDAHIFFASIRPNYRWSYFGKTLVYSFAKTDRVEQCVIFWNTQTYEKYVKYVKKLLTIRAAGNLCCLTTKADDETGEYILILCNGIGAPVASKYIPIEPLHVAMNESVVVAASDDIIYAWTFSDSNQSNDLFPATVLPNANRSRCFSVDDPFGGIKASETLEPFGYKTNDFISTIACSDRYLFIGRDSGVIQQYNISSLSLEAKYSVGSRPHQISINCDSTRMGIIDMAGAMTMFQLTKEKTVQKVTDFERKDVWDVKWSSDNAEMVATMEKNRMYIFRGVDPEEPVLTSAHICEFRDLTIRAVDLDELLREPEHPSKDSMILFETRSLRDTREMLDAPTISIQDCFAFIDEYSHERLWSLLADKALERLDFLVAEQAFVRSRDFQGIDFVKRLQVLGDKKKQQAEVAAYFKRFDDAELLYKEIDRRDLAIDLRRKLGNWIRVVHLVQEGSGDDRSRIEAFHHLGQYHADRQKWSKAAEFFRQSKSFAELVNCYYHMEDFVALEGLLREIPAEDTDVLTDVGDKFLSVGLCDQAVHSYLRSGAVRSAIDACVQLNQWDRAVKLAEEHHFPEISGLLNQYATHLLEKKHAFQAVELYDKAGMYGEAAQLLSDMANSSENGSSNPIRAKKLHVLAALKIDMLRRKMFHQQNSVGSSRSGPTLEGLMQFDSSTISLTSGGWRGAEAYHYFALAQLQLYENQLQNAMMTSLRLREFDDILDTRACYNLIALSTYLNGFFAQCSRAFVKLENLPNLADEDRVQYRKLAVQIFTSFRLEDPPCRKYHCPSCGEDVREWEPDCSHCGHKFPGDIVTGAPIFSGDVYTCSCCHRVGLKASFFRRNTCPLCHEVVNL